MNVYAAIGHFKGNENITCIALMQSSKKEFMTDCYGNEFVPYVVLTEKMLNKIQSSADIYEQVKKMTTNYRVWNDVADYLTECLDIITDKVENAKAQG
ncbi:MAG: hypothetical protein ACLT1T_00135 [Oscillospiraceae bacterium]